MVTQPLACGGLKSTLVVQQGHGEVLEIAMEAWAERYRSSISTVDFFPEAGGQPLHPSDTPKDRYWPPGSEVGVSVVPKKPCISRVRLVPSKLCGFGATFELGEMVPVEKLKHIWAQRMTIPVEHLQLRFKGNPVKPEQSLIDLGCVPNDREVIEFQVLPASEGLPAEEIIVGAEDGIATAADDSAVLDEQMASAMGMTSAASLESTSNLVEMAAMARKLEAMAVAEQTNDKIEEVEALGEFLQVLAGDPEEELMTDDEWQPNATADVAPHPVDSQPGPAESPLTAQEVLKADAAADSAEEEQDDEEFQKALAELTGGSQPTNVAEQLKPGKHVHDASAEERPAKVARHANSNISPARAEAKAGEVMSAQATKDEKQQIAVELSSSDDEEPTGKTRKEANSSNLRSDTELRDLLAELGSEAAIRDQKRIPQTARQLWAYYIPKSSISVTLDILAEAMVDQKIHRGYRLAIFYVYHEWLVQAPKIKKQIAAEEGIKSFLEPIGETIRRLSTVETKPYLKTLELWDRMKIYPSSFIQQVRNFWAEGKLTRQS
eukprot:gnl/MRDRNA2_/MRDRNA2_137072_c0_seq1.p1 gnl/MRDRNA2_/MRDRNA2_137072_c0~~gnl/MRDRNA2_/MRDRNA2_137072_c0_seq1.p1  ORF type:complete len:550 (+),score=145.04 gnl/MRDRNA2_/MRDRNA2_137072_c0_seq1:1-1650(+)